MYGLNWRIPFILVERSPRSWSAPEIRDKINKTAYMAKIFPLFLDWIISQSNLLLRCEMINATNANEKKKSITNFSEKSKMLENSVLKVQQISVIKPKIGRNAPNE